MISRSKNQALLNNLCHLGRIHLVLTSTVHESAADLSALNSLEASACKAEGRLSGSGTARDRIMSSTSFGTPCSRASSAQSSYDGVCRISSSGSSCRGATTNCLAHWKHLCRSCGASAGGGASIASRSKRRIILARHHVMGGNGASMSLMPRRSGSIHCSTFCGQSDPQVHSQGMGMTN